ncbi:hypothetical protein C8F01DRAFT_1135192 [Mycena amicta]|nr:hypothetical protein C8F01DRAFT_1135192 [Mycena amicta]
MTTPPSIDSFPGEIWLEILLQLADSKPTLSAAMRVSRQFNEWACKPLVQQMTWPSTQLALDNLSFWDRKPSKTKFVSTLALRAVEPGVDPSLVKILGYIARFKNLYHIKLMGPSFPSSVVFEAIKSLRHLREITLIGCDLGSTSQSPMNLTPVRLNAFRSSRQWHSSLLQFPTHLPHLTALVTDTVTLPVTTSVCQQLTSLTLTLSEGFTLPERLNRTLARTPALVHLDVSIPLRHPSVIISPDWLADNFSGQVVMGDFGQLVAFSHGGQQMQPPPPRTPNAPSLAHLRALSVPWHVLHDTCSGLLAGAPNVVHLRVSSPIQNGVIDEGQFVDPQTGYRSGPDFVADFLLRLQATHPAMETVSLCLMVWDDRILWTIAQHLHACEVLELVYHSGAPRMDSLLKVCTNPEGLPAMRHLHTLRLIPSSPIPTPAQDPAFMRCVDEPYQYDDFGFGDHVHLPHGTMLGVPMRPFPMHPAGGERSEQAQDSSSAAGNHSSVDVLHRMQEHLSALATPPNGKLTRIRLGYPDPNTEENRTKTMSLMRVPRGGAKWAWVEDVEHGDGVERKWNVSKLGRKLVKREGGWWEDMCRELIAGID